MTATDRDSDGYTDSYGNLTQAGELSWAMSRLGASSLRELQEQGAVTDADHWLIKGLIATSRTYIYGQSNVGKSFLVSQMIASLVDGRRILDREPVSKGHKVLIMTTDTEGQKEYQERLTDLGVNPDSVIVIESSVFSPERWEDTAELVALAGVDVVVLDHATDALEGDFNQRESWRDLWSKLDALGSGVARVLIGHATDSKFEGSPIHRPGGSYAATALVRSRVYLWAPDGVESPLREIRTLANNATPETLRCTRGTNGFIEHNTEASTKNQERSQARISVQVEIVRLAVDKAPPGSQSAVARWVSEQPGIVTTNGDKMSPSTVRNALNRSSSVSWNRDAGRYHRNNTAK